VKGVRPLTDAERALVAYLRERFAFRGAAIFVRRYGLELVSRAVSDYEAAGDVDDVEKPSAFLVWLVRDLSDE
jgi:hypothetical protein